MSVQQTTTGTGSAPARRRGATWTVLVFSTATTAFALLVGVRALLRAAGVVGIDVAAEVQGGAGSAGIFDEEQIRNTDGMFAMIILGVALACLVLTVGLATFRPWAREGALGLFGLGGLALGLLSFSGLGRGAPNAPLGLALGITLLAVAALVATPACAGDFHRAALRRAQRKENKRRGASAR